MKLNDFVGLLHNRSYTLYYGTCRGKALELERNGFNKSVMSREKELILVSTVDMAERQAADNECDAIMRVVNVSFNSIRPYRYTGKDSVVEMVKLLDGKEPTLIRLVKDHRNFTYVNKITKR
jgi:hypothetical protein